jgi:hypothetical protein
MKRNSFGFGSGSFLFYGLVAVALITAPNPASAQTATPKKADAEACAKDDECQSGFCDPGLKVCTQKPAAAAPAAPEKCVDDDDCNDGFCHITKFGPNPSGFCDTVAEDPCDALPIGDDELGGCEIAAAQDLGMPGTPAAVRGILLKMSPKRFEAYKKEFSRIVRTNVWKFFDYKTSARDRLFKEDVPGYWDDAKVLEFLKKNPNNNDLIGAADHRRTTSSSAAPRKVVPADRD